VCALDGEGKPLLSRKIANDETEIVTLLTTANALAQQLVWAVDIIGAPSALILSLLTRAGQSVRYASGRIVSAMSRAYPGEGRTDAKDAYVIAETARIRRDLPVIDHDTDLVRNLAVLTGYRADLIADRVRMINRLRDLMTSVFPSLEREFDYSSHKGALVLLTGYASPDRIRRVGQTRLAGWLRHRKVRDCASMATRAVDAAKAQSTVLPGQDLATTIVAELATSILALDERLKTLDEQIEQTFKQHPQATIIQSMPGFGPFLGAALLVGAGDLRAFPSAGHLAAAAGLVPVPNDSGRRTGKPAPATPIQPPPPACVLPVGANQHDASRPEPRLLPQETSQRPHPQPGRHRPRPPPSRCALVTAARQPTLGRGSSRTCAGGLTTTLRFPVTGHSPVLGLGRPLGNVDHVRDPVLALADLPRRPADRPTGT